MLITGTNTGPLEFDGGVKGLGFLFGDVEVVVAKQTAGFIGISLMFFLSCACKKLWSALDDSRVK